MALGIIEVLKRVGEENVKVQLVLKDLENITLGKHGTRISFITDPAIVAPNDIAAEKPRNIGILLWVPTELLEKARIEPSVIPDTGLIGSEESV